MERIDAVQLETNAVYDNCNIVRSKITKYLARPGVTQTAFLRILGINCNSFNKFRRFNGKGAGAGNGTYPAAYRFFEKKRILEGKPKTAKRKTAELHFGPAGYRLRHDDGKRWCFGGAPTDPSIFDIDACAARRYHATGGSREGGCLW